MTIRRFTAILLTCFAVVSSAEGQSRISVSAGGAVIARPDRHATLGFQVGIAGLAPVSTGVNLRWEGFYQQFSPWQFSNDLCPPQGCSPERESNTAVGGVGLGLELGAPDPGKVYVMGGLGIYRITEGGNSDWSGGAHGGLGIALNRHIALELRYHWIPASELAVGLLPLSLAWTFQP
jgi:hypothetical protein